MATVGLLLNTVGVVGLFFFGMPYVVRGNGAIYLVTGGRDEAAERKERIYDVLGWISLGLILAGVILQVWAINA
jgi:hypothetical protein